jgi:uncharacterized protein YndB with AHSA1/START domain
MTSNAERGASGRPDLTITRLFDAPRSLVWKAWTDPAHMARWWGPKGYDNPVCDLEVRPGGKIHIEMRGPDGTVYPMKGSFDEIVEPERLVLTCGAIEKPDGTFQLEVHTTVTFAEQGGKTKLTMTAHVLRIDPGAEFAGDGMEQGWTESFERLAAHVASM